MTDTQKVKAILKELRNHSWTVKIVHSATSMAYKFHLHYEDAARGKEVNMTPVLADCVVAFAEDGTLDLWAEKIVRQMKAGIQEMEEQFPLEDNNEL